MLKANIQAQLDQKEKELYQVDQDIWKLARVISGLHKQLDILRSNKTAIESKIDDLKDQMEED